MFESHNYKVGERVVPSGTVDNIGVILKERVFVDGSLSKRRPAAHMENIGIGRLENIALLAAIGP